MTKSNESEIYVVIKNERKKPRNLIGDLVRTGILRNILPKKTSNKMKVWKIYTYNFYRWYISKLLIRKVSRKKEVILKKTKLTETQIANVNKN